MESNPILRAHTWRNNADLIANGVVPLGYIRPDDVVLDPTYGKGKWWDEYRPANLTAHDLKTDGVTWGQIPNLYTPATFDVIAFDPPYIAPGGRKTSTVAGFNDSYGIDHCAPTPAQLEQEIGIALIRFATVLKPRGLLLLKAMNYVTSGAYRPAAYNLLNVAVAVGYRLVDEFVHVGGTGPQPARDRQHHTRANYSLLFVLRRA